MMHVWMRTSEKSPTTFHSLIHPLAFIAMVMVVLHLSQGFTKKEFHACCTDIIATQSLALCALCFPIPSFKFSIFVFSQFSSLPLYYFFNFFFSCKACRAHRNVIFMKLFSFSSSWKYLVSVYRRRREIAHIQFSIIIILAHKPHILYIYSAFILFRNSEFDRIFFTLYLNIILISAFRRCCLDRCLKDAPHWVN